MTKIINLTQHEASAEQKKAGVIEPVEKERIKRLLTFDEIPSKVEIRAVASALAEIAADEKVSAAMIGGAPFLMSALEFALRNGGIKPLYAFSKRESAEEKLPDGSTRKTTVFKHLGFVEV